MAIKKNTPVPLYFQLAEQIRAQIESGELKAGSQLPSERVLGEQARISRMTARQAINYLVRQGHLVVRPGVGTFVGEPKLTHDTLHLLGFTEEMLAHGHAATSQVLEQSVVPLPAAVATRLNRTVADLATKIVRLRLTQNTPLLLESVFVPQAMAPGLEREDLSQTSLYAVLEERFDVQLNRARQTLEVTTATEAEAQLFGVAPGTTMLLLEGVTYSTDEHPVESFKALYRGDKFKFALESQRLGGDATQNAPRLSVVLRENS